MPAQPLTDFSRLCLHTITTKPWSIEEATDRYAAAGVKGVTVWRQWLEGRDIAKVGASLRAAGLEVVSLCRGGFFPAVDASGRRAAIDDNLPHRRCGRTGRAADRAGLRLKSPAALGGVATPNRRRHRRRARPGGAVRRPTGHRALAPDVRRRPIGRQHDASGERDV